MGGFWLDKEIQDLLNLWLTRILVLSSFAAHLCLALLAGIRRREGSGWRRKLVWFAYQVTDNAPKAALGKLFLDGPSGNRLPFAFWVPFLLLHLGLPDNISAYSLEDNKLSGRQMLDISLDLGGAFYGAYKQKFLDGDRVLGSAFFIMFFLGFCKYVERAWALWQAGFAEIRRSNKKKPLRRFSAVQHEKEKLGNDNALLDAHGLLGITMGAFADYSVLNFNTSYSYWYDVVKVVEMELSLMYDIMYTKAAAIHTWLGYILRVTSPPLTATALFLFLCHGKEGLNWIDINITYLLLIGTWLLDVRWLLRALGSTWTYAFLQGTECDLLKETLCCRCGRWYRLRRFIFSMDPRPLLGLRPKEPSGHRAWSRTVGQHNLLHECTGGTQMKKIGWEGDVGVMSLLEELCKDILKPDKPMDPEEKKKKETEEKKPAAAVPLPDDKGYKERRKFSDDRLFGPEFDELVIAWHIATDVFLLGRPESHIEELPTYQKIKAISNYMMFLVAERPEMLPGLKLHSNYENMSSSLKEIWKKDKSNNSRCRHKDKKLAKDLQDEDDAGRLYSSNTILSEATKYAKVLEQICWNFNTESCTTWTAICKAVGIDEDISTQRRLLILVPRLEPFAADKDNEIVYRMELERVLERYILKSWVRLLIFASIRSSRDSHAKQLSCGGELTTVIWILAEHRERVGYRERIEN